MTPPALLLGALESLLNRLLARDPHALAQLQALGGGVVLRLTELDWELGVYPVAHGVVLGPAERGARAQVELQTKAVFALLRDPRAGRAVPGMHVAGDAEYLQRFVEVFQGLEADLAGLLEPWLGEQAAPAAAGLRRVQGFLRRGLSGLEASGAEFLAEESRDLVPATELEDWMREVEELDLDVERFEARLRRVERRAGHGGEPVA